ncbi:uncharacterized protein LOC134281160 isoform X2 [Saccostrea cucullata]|uniref:uncharacterized protein LOC134281160 isoform X2 n=1 Tax=Saccostrea cuccullata TaxID=36930 RepID=UPI002ED25A18
MTYNPAFYKGLNIPDYNPNSIPFVNYNPMKEQKPRPFSEFQSITTSVPEAPKMNVFGNPGNAGIKFDPKIVTPSPFDNLKFDPNNRNFLKGFNPNSFADKVEPFQVVQVTESTAGHDWDGGWPAGKSNGMVQTKANEKTESGANSSGNSGKNVFGSSGKSWDGSWPEGDVKEFSSKATESWNSAVGAKQVNKNWQGNRPPTYLKRSRLSTNIFYINSLIFFIISDNSGDFSNKATDSWNKALNQGKNQGNKNGLEEVDEIIQSLIAALEKLYS